MKWMAVCEVAGWVAKSAGGPPWKIAIPSYSGSGSDSAGTYGRQCARRKSKGENVLTLARRSGDSGSFF
jgi:hypothetical protein